MQKALSSRACPSRLLTFGVTAMHDVYIETKKNIDDLLVAIATPWNEWKKKRLNSPSRVLEKPADYASRNVDSFEQS